MPEKMTVQLTTLIRMMQAMSQSDVPRDEAERRFRQALAEQNLTPAEFAAAIGGHVEILAH